MTLSMEFVWAFSLLVVVLAVESALNNPPGDQQYCRPIFEVGRIVAVVVVVVMKQTIALQR